MLFTCCFFPERLLSDLHTFRMCPLWGYLRGGFGTLYTPGVEHFVVIVSYRLLLQKVPSWVFGGVMNASLWCYFLGVTMKLFHLVFILLICYLHCYYRIIGDFDFRCRMAYILIYI